MSRWDDVTAHLTHQVTFSETDALGFVHHGNIARWFEQAREVFFNRFGTAPSEMVRGGRLLALRQLNVRYDHFVAYEDKVTIRVALTKLGRVACDFHYRVDDVTTGKLAIRGHTNVVAVRVRAPGEPPTLRSLGDERAPFAPLVVDADAFLDAPPGAWAPPRWEPG